MNGEYRSSDHERCAMTEGKEKQIPTLEEGNHFPG